MVGCLKPSSPPPSLREKEEISGGKKEGGGRKGRTNFTPGILYLRGLSQQQPLKHPRTETLRREEGGTWRERGEGWREKTRRENEGVHREEVWKDTAWRENEVTKREGEGEALKEKAWRENESPQREGELIGGEQKENGGNEREEGVEGIGPIPACPWSTADVSRANKEEDWAEVDMTPNRHLGQNRNHRHPHTPPRTHRSPRPCRAPPKTHQESSQPLWYLTPTSGALLLIQGILLTFIVAFMRYSDMADAGNGGNNNHHILGGNNPEDNIANILHYCLVLTLVLAFVCPGLRLTSLPDHANPSATGTCILTISMAFQWALLCHTFMGRPPHLTRIDIFSLLEACEVCVGLVVGVWGLLGLSPPLAVVLVSLLYVPLHLANMQLYAHLKVVDRGGSVCVHAFGAAFGVGLCLGRRTQKSTHKNRSTTSKTGQLTSLLGSVITCILMCEVWAWKTEGDDHHRALINTCLALLSSCLTAFPASSLAHPRRKFTLSDIECGMVAGCVAVGGAAEMMVEPWGAVLIGATASLAAVLTRRFVAPGMYDGSVGVGHGVGGVVGGLVGAVMAATAWVGSSYGVSLYELFPAMAPKEGSDELAEVNKYYRILPGEARNPATQAALTLAALTTALTIASTAGALIGLLLRIPILGKSGEVDIFSDDQYWHLPSPPHSPPSSHCHHHHHHC